MNAFNRTSMELKLSYLGNCSKSVRCPFNRTSMELKPTKLEVLPMSFELLIEPVWN